MTSFDGVTFVETATGDRNPMTPEEIVKALRRERWDYTNEAADLIERQVKALEESEKALVDGIGEGRVTRALAAIRAARGEG